MRDSMRLCFPLKEEYMRLLEPASYDLQVDVGNQNANWYLDHFKRQIVERYFHDTPRANTVYRLRFPAGLVLRVHNYSLHRQMEWCRMRVTTPVKMNDKEILDRISPGRARMQCWLPLSMFMGVDIEIIRTNTPS